MRVEFKTDKPKLLDLYCCAGGAAKGYTDAGFEVVGVDIINRPNYPYQFIKADALEILKDKEFVEQFDAIHASPPCQHYSRLKHLSGNVEAWEESHVDLVAPTRELIEKYNKPYIIENVVGAPLINPITLKGSQFKGMMTQRPRLFESNIDLYEPEETPYSLGTAKLGTISETGAVSVCGNKCLQGLNEVQTKLYYGIALGGIDWMSLEELTQCIPPCYTKFLGRQLLYYIKENKTSERKEQKSIEDIVREILSSDEFVKLIAKLIA